MTSPRTYPTPATASREADLVEVVDVSGTPIGSTTVAEAHTLPGKLHRAFSVILADDHGRLLLQQRAACKTRFALRWANTCCGHPAPGQDVYAAGSTRLFYEMGLLVDDLVDVGRFVYRAEDPATGRVEHEYDHVLLGRVSTGTVPSPNPDEVAEWRWVARDELRGDLATRPERYSPWLPAVFDLATRQHEQDLPDAL